MVERQGNLVVDEDGDVVDSDHPYFHEPSAGKHGITKADALHAYRNVMHVLRIHGDMTRIAGPAQDGTMLDIGFSPARDYPGFDAIIHAMKLPSKKPSKKRSPRKR